MSTANSCFRDGINLQFELADDHSGEGYGSWNAAHQQGKAGVFTAEVSEILEGVVKMAG